MKKRLFLGTLLLLLAAALGVAFVLPASRHRVLGFLRGEHLYNGRALDYWVAALKDADPPVRREAALVLGEAQVCKDREPEDPECQRVLAALIAALADEDGFVRKCAATSFLIHPQTRAVPNDPATIAGLLSGLKDDQIVVRKAAVRALWQAFAAAKQEDGVACLMAALGDEDAFVREYAVRALGRIGPDAGPAVPAMLKRLKDEDSEVRDRTAKSLGRVGVKAIGPRLLPETITALRQGLKDDGPYVRANCALALGQLGGVEAIPDLRLALQDPNERVRTVAADALKTLEAQAVKKGP